MVMAVGCGGPDAAMFHLSTHAFFKALLFLAAGSVIHAMHDEQDIWKMGGLFKKIPLTSVCFLIGFLALSGVPPFAGFFSKDYVLSIALARSPWFYWVGVFTAFLTAFYMTRLFVVAFFGSARTKAAEHPHESPPVMTVPLVILSVLAVCGGFIGLKPYYNGWSASVLAANNQAGIIPAPEDTGLLLEMIVPSLFVIAGLGLAYVLYAGAERDPLHIKVLANKFYVDEFYDRSLVGGQQLTARMFNWFDSWILDGLIIRGSAFFSVGVGELLRLFQTGSLQTYAFLFSLGGLVLIYFTLFSH
jgi:NADH-quinone oxidoreductase subunit L